MTAHDSTYGQTVHARTFYYPENVRFGQRFVDVISEVGDGRMMIDYEKFHDTEPMDGVDHGSHASENDGV